MIEIFVVIAIHIIGSIIALIIRKKNGTFKHAKKYGDGIRIAKPSDVVFRCLVIWEIDLFIYICDIIGEFINSRDW